MRDSETQYRVCCSMLSLSLLCQCLFVASSTLTPVNLRGSAFLPWRRMSTSFSGMMQTVFDMEGVFEKKKNPPQRRKKKKNQGRVIILLIVIIVCFSE